MNELWNKYLQYKKITIPVTVIIVGLIIGGVFYGISTSSNKKSTKSPQEAKSKTEKVVTPEYICYDKAGTYSDKETYDTGEITVGDVTVENATFNTLTVTEGVGEGTVTLNNDTVKKILVVNGGGTNSLHINGGTYDEIVSNKYNCHIVIDETCSVDKLTVPSTALVEVNGTVKTANVVPSTYEGEITWETGFKAGEKANITALNISEEVKDDVTVEDTTGNAVKEEKTLTKEETSKVQANVQKVTTTAQNNSSVAKNEATNNGTNASASANVSTPSNNVAPTPSTPSNSGNNNSNTKPSIPSNNKPSTPTVSYVTCPDCGETYEKGTTHDCMWVRTCPLCGAKYKDWEAQYHDCPYTHDYYGNVVRKDSRYVVGEGNYNIKKYSDGTYDIPQATRDLCEPDYIDECKIQGDHWGSLDAYIIACRACI